MAAEDVLVVDAGSHSLRLVVVTTDGRRRLARTVDDTPDGPQAREALSAFVDEAGEVGAVGHRVVHGGERIVGATLVDDEVLAALRRAAPLAPLHVPPALAAIEATRERLADVPHVVAVDTALSGGRSRDTRELVALAASGDAAARLALDVFTFRVGQEIASAAACLDRLDVLVITGEIGADQPEVREAVCAGLPLLGLRGGLEPVVDDDRIVSAAGASVPVVVVVTGEDLQVAAETRDAITQHPSPSGRGP